MTDLFYSFFRAYNVVHEINFCVKCFYNRVTPLESSASAINSCIDYSPSLSPYEKEYNKYCVNLSQDFLRKQIF